MDSQTDVASHLAAGPTCFTGAFTEGACCDTVKYGPKGNTKCWGNFSFYNFERCCIQVVTATKQLRHLLSEFAKALYQNDMDAALVSLQTAREMNLQSHDVEFDVAIFNAKSGLPPREMLPGDSCSLQRPYYHLLQNVKPWSGSQRFMPSLLCIVYTAARAHRVLTQWETWGHKCDYFEVFSDRPWPPSLPAMPFKVRVVDSEDQEMSGYGGIWQHLRTLWLDITRPAHNINTTFAAGWRWAFLSPDDLFVVVENLRKELLRLQSEQPLGKPLYVGHPMRHGPNGKFNSGGAGFALNRAAGKALRSALLFESACDSSIHGADDVMIAICLAHRGIFPQETAPGGGFLRFHPFMLDLFLEGEGRTNGPSSWQELIVPLEGFRCCAEDSISFHDMSPAHLMEVWGAVYACRPNGGDVRALIEMWSRLWPSAIDYL